MRFTDHETGAKLSHSYSANKYAGGTYCGTADMMATIDQCLEWANDGFCDYCRIVCDDGSVLKVHFTTPEQETHQPAGARY